MQKVETVLEPMIKATIIAPEEFTGAIINLCTVRQLLPPSVRGGLRVRADAIRC